jgi:hypothetical protein
MCVELCYKVRFLDSPATGGLARNDIRGFSYTF